MAVGLFIVSGLTLESPIWMVVLGLFVAPNNSALMGDAPRTRRGIAAGVLVLIRNMGMALGIGLTRLFSI